MASEQLKAFLEARDFLFRHRDDYQTAYRGFRWPKQEQWVDDVLQMCPSNAVRDGHSVLLVGYRDDTAQPGGGVFLFRNTARNGWDGSMPYAFARAYMNDAVWIDYKSPTNFQASALRPVPLFRDPPGARAPRLMTRRFVVSPSGDAAGRGRQGAGTGVRASRAPGGQDLRLHGFSQGLSPRESQRDRGVPRGCRHVIRFEKDGLRRRR